MSAPIRPAWQMPIQWPGPADRPLIRAGALAERLVKSGIVCSLLALTVLDRFGVRISDTYAVSPAMLAMYALAAAMAAAAAAEYDRRALLAYAMLAGVAVLGFLVNTWFAFRSFVSLESLLLLLALYAPFAVRLLPAAPADWWRWAVSGYIAFSIVLAIAGIAQFFTQFAATPQWLFDYTYLIPAPIRGIEGLYNTVNAAGDWIKSNGFFLREASMFSSAMAFAVLFELNGARRRWVIALLALALVVTYSGSGLVILAVALLFPLGWRSIRRLLACALAGAAIYFALGDVLNLDYTIERVQEYRSERSSAYQRFIQPVVAVVDNIDTDVWTPVLGHGPGTMHPGGASFDTTPFKLFFEYGLLGVLAMGALMLQALRRPWIPIRVRVAVGVHWLLLGGYLLAPAPVLLIYLFCAMWPEEKPA